MGRLINTLLGRKQDEPPKGESPVLPAHGPALPDGSLTFPNGIRMAIVEVDGATWELINHTDEKLITFRHLDDRDATKAPVFQLHEPNIAETVLEIGTLLHPKKLEQLAKGAWLDGLHPGTFFSASDAKDPPDKRTGLRDTYVLPYADLIRFLLTKVQASQGMTDVSEARSSEGSRDGGRTGEQPTAGGAGAGEAR